MASSTVKKSRVASGRDGRNRAASQKQRRPSSPEMELERLLSILRETVAAQIAASPKGEDWGDQSEED